MPSATETSQARGGGAGDNLLKGSDLPAKIQKINVVCVETREAPEEFNSPLIMDIEPVYGKVAFPLNKTNMKALVTLIDDDYDKWSGYDIELSKYLTRNPKTGQQAWGLMVTKATKLRRKVNREVTE